MKLYIRWATDDPHVERPDMAGLSKCGLILGDAQEISEVQALVYLANRRCRHCVPAHAQMEERRHRV